MMPFVQIESPQTEKQNFSKEVLAVFAVLGFACVAYLFLSPFRTFYPNVDLKTVLVTGESDLLQDEMLRRFTSPAETILQQMPEADSIASQTMDRYARITITLTPEENSNNFTERLRAALKGLEVPAKVKRLQVAQPSPVFYFSSNESDHGHLQSTVAKFKTALNALSRVESVEVSDPYAPKQNLASSTSRLDGVPSIVVRAIPVYGIDAIALFRDTAHLADRLVSGETGVRVRMPHREASFLSKKITLMAVAGLVGLLITSVLLLMMYRNRSATLSFALFMLIAFCITFVVSGVLEISINHFTVVAYFFSGGCAFVLGGMLQGFYHRPHGKGVRTFVLPLVATLVGVGFVFVFPWIGGGIFESIVLTGGLVYGLLLVISTIVFLAVLPHWTRVISALDPLPLGWYRRFLSGLFAKRKWRVLAWMLPQGAILYVVLSLFIGNGNFYFTISESRSFLINVTCPRPSQGNGVVHNLEKQLSEQEDVDHVLVTSGFSTGRAFGYDNFGPEYSEIKVWLKENRSEDTVGALLYKLQQNKECRVTWQAEGTMGKTGDETIFVSGNDLSVIQSMTAEVQEAVAKIAANAGCFLEKSNGTVNRRNGENTSILSLEMGDMRGYREPIEEMLVQIGNRFPGYIASLEEPDRGNEQLLSRLAISAVLVSGILLLLHVLASIRFRSFLPALILFSPLYIAAGIFLFSGDIYVIVFLLVPAMAPLLVLVVFLFLQVLREGHSPVDGTIMLNLAEQLFKSTAPPIVGVAGTGAFVALAIPSLRPIALAILGGLVLLSYFIWILIPAYFAPSDLRR